MLGLVRLNHHKIVVTAHNRAPHGDYNRFDQWFRQQVYRQAKAIVVLISGHATELRDNRVVSSDAVVTPIPHPLTHTEGVAPGGAVDGSLVILGQIHPYHLIENFLDALDTAGNKRTVVIAGRVGDEGLVRRLEQRCKTTPWLQLHAGYATEEELQGFLSSAAALVSLQRNTFNSGGPYLALPLALPVILSEGAQAQELKTEFGAEWVYSLPEAVKGDDLDGLESWILAQRSPLDLTRYDIASIINEHTSLYELLRD